MATFTQDLTAAGAGTVASLEPGQSYTYAAAGTFTGFVAFQRSRNPGTWETVEMSAADTGIGIPMELLESVFQEFTQVDSSTTRKAGGTGLGLPISRKLIEMHGGRLWAESTGVAGEGSTFIVIIPLEVKFTEPVEKTEK